MRTHNDCSHSDNDNSQAIEIVQRNERKKKQEKPSKKCMYK